MINVCHTRFKVFIIYRKNLPPRGACNFLCRYVKLLGRDIFHQLTDTHRHTDENMSITLTADTRGNYLPDSGYCFTNYSLAFSADTVKC